MSDGGSAPSGNFAGFGGRLTFRFSRRACRSMFGVAVRDKAYDTYQNVRYSFRLLWEEACVYAGGKCQLALGSSEHCDFGVLYALSAGSLPCPIRMRTG